MHDKLLAMTLPDGSAWGVPVMMIAEDRAKHYSSEFGGDVQRSLDEDTLPLFKADAFEIEDWAVNNMNWSDFDGHQVQLKAPAAPDFQQGWMDSDKTIVAKPC